MGGERFELVDRAAAAETIRRLNEDDLRFLNRLIVERLKLIGQARISVNVKVMGIGKSVEISAQRTFVGSNGDPSFLEVMGAETGESAVTRTFSK